MTLTAIRFLAVALSKIYTVGGIKFEKNNLFVLNEKRKER